MFDFSLLWSNGIKETKKKSSAYYHALVELKVKSSINVGCISGLKEDKNTVYEIIYW